MTDNHDQAGTHREIVTMTITALKESKTHSIKLKKTAEHLSELADRMIEKEEKKLELLDMIELGDSSIFDLPEYEIIKRGDERRYDVITTFSHELSDLSIYNITTAASADSIYHDSGSSFSGLVTLAAFIPEDKRKSNFDQFGKYDDFFSVVDEVKHDLSEINPLLASQFESLIQKFCSYEDPDEKASILLGLRSIIFDRIFEHYCPQKDFQKASWHRTGMKKHFCESKYFIQDNMADSDIQSSLLKQILNISTDIERLFHELSDIGKTGKNANNADIVFKKTVFSFASALSLRKALINGPKQK